MAHVSLFECNFCSRRNTLRYIPLHTAFHYHPSIVLIWLKYYQKDVKSQVSHPSILCTCVVFLPCMVIGKKNDTAVFIFFFFFFFCIISFQNKIPLLIVVGCYQSWQRTLQPFQSHKNFVEPPPPPPPPTFPHQHTLLERWQKIWPPPHPLQPYTFTILHMYVRVTAEGCASPNHLPSRLPTLHRKPDQFRW